MLSRFENLLPKLAFIAAIVLIAKATSLVFDAFMPPLPKLECKEAVAKLPGQYRFASAFGLKSATRKSAAKKAPAKKTVSLKGYTLTMTAVGEPSMALIERKGKSRFVTVGGTIDGFRLEEVYTDRVKLTKNGREYWLSMKKSGTSALAAPPKKKKSGKKGAEKYVEQIRREENTYFVPRELLHEMHDIKKIFRYIAISPVYRENKLVGFGVSNVKKGSVFDKMGLKKRDIIEKIDGKPIKSESDAFQYFNRLEQLNSLSLTIKRGKERKELKYEIF
ncbi:PDZ domain-containing protein [Hydrogenimonas sp.]